MALIYHAGGVHSAFYSSEVFEPLLQARPLSALVLISYLLFWCHLKLLGFRVQFSNLFICVEIWDFFFSWATKALAILVSQKRWKAGKCLDTIWKTLVSFPLEEPSKIFHWFLGQFEKAYTSCNSCRKHFFNIKSELLLTIDNSENLQCVFFQWCLNLKFVYRRRLWQYTETEKKNPI